MSEKRPTVEEIDAETEELLQRAITLKEKVKSDVVKGLKELVKTTDVSHIQSDEQLFEELKELLGQVVHDCDELQNYLSNLDK